MKRFLQALLFIGLSFFMLFELQSCKDERVNSTSEIVFPETNVRFSKHVEPLFQQKCALALCHSGSDPKGGLSLEYNSYQSIMNKLELVRPYNGDNSSLVQHLKGILLPMPPPHSPQLTQNQIDGVKRWIDEGAQNN